MGKKWMLSSPLVSSKDLIWAVSEGHDLPTAQSQSFPPGFRLLSLRTFLQEHHVLSSEVNHFKHTAVSEAMLVALVPLICLVVLSNLQKIIHHVITLWKLIYSFIPHFSIMPPGKMLLDEKLSWITFFLQSTEMRVMINPLYISGLHKLLLNCHFNYSWMASLPPGKFHRDFK